MRSLLFFLLFSWSATGYPQQFTSTSGHAGFLSKAALNEFEGVSEQLNGLLDFDKNLIDFYLDLNTLKTGIGLRDRHMRENYLETERFPFAEFTGRFEKIPSLSGAVEQVRAIGKFKMHGVEHEISVPGELRMLSDGKLELKARFIVSLSEYKIQIPKLVFYELASEQEVSIALTLSPNKP